MYVPSHFEVSDRDRLLDFVETHSFGLLVAPLDGEPFASHLPLLVERGFGPWGALVGHMARANPHWQTTERRVLVVFSGPHAYISPTWYSATRVVPTWNYVAVHVYGALELIDDRAATQRIVREYVARYERDMPRPWSVADDDAYVDQLAQAVVAFRIVIERIEGKYKLSQNHPRERRERIVAALNQRGDENAREIAALMTESLRATE